jgi:hypothetical protein
MNKMKVEIGVVNAVKAGAKVLKAIYHDAEADTIKGYLTEAKDALSEAVVGMDEAPAMTGTHKLEASVAVAVTTDIPRDEINEDKIDAIAESIDKGLTTIDDWNLTPTEGDVLGEKMHSEFHKDVFGENVGDDDDDEGDEDGEGDDDETADPTAPVEDTIVDETPAEEYDGHDKKLLKELIGFGAVIRKAARSVNRHIDNETYTPNREKLRKMNLELICKIKKLLDYFENEGKVKAAEFAKHLIGCAYELREKRFVDAVTERATFVKRFETKVNFVD